MVIIKTLVRIPPIPELLTSQANEIQPIKLIIIFKLKKKTRNC